MLALLSSFWALIVANQVGIAGAVAYLLLEWYLPRIKWLKANSTVELLANLAKRALLNKVPLVGKVVSVLATPEEPKEKEPENKS